MSKRKPSDVWNFFSKESEESAFAVCNICKKKISRGGKSHTTSNLNKHLRTYHMAQLMSLKKQKQGPHHDHLLGSDQEDEINAGASPSRPIGLDESLEIDIPSPHLSSLSSPSEASGRSSTSPSLTPKDLGLSSKVQPTLGGFLQKKAKFRSNDPRAKAITKKIGEMICLDNQPFSIVEDQGFTSLLCHLEARYEMPKRKYFSTVVIPTMYQETKMAVHSLIQHAEHVSITTDMWTSSSNDDYMSLTAHFMVDGDWKHISLECIPFPEVNHSAEAIAKFLKEVVKKWEIENKIHVIVRDNARNVVAAMTSGNFTGIPCLAHTLQLVVKDALLNHKSVLNLSASCRRTVGHFKHSAQATKVLKSAQQLLGIKQHRLIQDEPTRWNSTKHMMDRLLEQRRAISYVAPELSKPIDLTGHDWELMEKVVKLLKIFDDATFQCSSAQTTISEVIPIVNSTKKELESLKSSTPGLLSFANDLINSLDKRYREIENVKEYTFATILDPRLKGSVFLSATSLEEAKQLLLLDANMVDVGRTSRPTSTTSGETSTPSSSEAAASTSTDRLKKKMFQRYSVLMEDAEKSSSTAELTAEKEMAQYFSEPLSSPLTNIPDFWKRESLTFPRLSNLARKYLSAPPATVFSERLFSTSGNICDKKRNRLDPERVQMLVFLNKNLKHKSST